MIERYCGGLIPAPVRDAQTQPDLELVAAIEQTVDQVTQDANRLDFSMALRGVWELIARLNKYIVVREPWVLAKSPDKRPVLDTTLYHAANALSVVASLIQPVMPETARKLGVIFASATRPWDDALKTGGLTPGLPIGKIEQLFPRIELTVEELRSNRSTPVSEQQNPAAPTTPTPAPAAAPVAAPAPSAGPSTTASRSTTFSRSICGWRESSLPRESELEEADEAVDRRRDRAANAGCRYRRGV